MAHEELKALYEIDRKHSDTPWEFWEYFSGLGGAWSDLISAPGWYEMQSYRRKPDAPVWPDDKEDARKWRELEAFYRGNGIRKTAKKFLEIIEPKQALIQGYTADQWQSIIDGKFLCEFADYYNFPKSPIISALHSRKDSGFCCEDEDGEAGAVFKNCRPLRIKGVRQPWFGGDCPVDGAVVIKIRGGQVEFIEVGTSLYWNHSGRPGDIIEFIEL